MVTTREGATKEGTENQFVGERRITTNEEAQSDVLSRPKLRDRARLLASKTRLPTCSDYGKNRMFLYPGVFFCHPCNMWDSVSFDKNTRYQRSSTRNRCVGNHTSWVKPTNRRLETNEEYKARQSKLPSQATLDGSTGKRARKKRKFFGDSDDESGYITVDNKIIKHLENDTEEYKKQIDNLCETVGEMEYSNKTLFEYNTTLESKLHTAISRNAELALQQDSLALNQETTLQSNSEVIDDLINEKMNLKNQLIEATDDVKKISAENKKLNIKYESVNTSMINVSMKLKTASKLNVKHANNQEQEKNKNERTNFSSISIVEFVNNFYKDLIVLSKYKNRNLNKMIAQVTKILFDPELFDGIFLEQLILRCQEYYKDNVFSPQNLLKMMDQNGGQISMSGIDLLRKLDTNGVKYCHNSIIPSSGSIKRACYVVDTVASELVPFVEGVLSTGEEFCEFNVPAVVNMMIKGYGLEEASKHRSIAINQALDGARLTTRLHHTTYGLKMVDLAARDPVTKQLIYGSTNETTLQSRKNCFPIKMVLAHETNEVYKEFEGPMQEMKNLTNEKTSFELLNGAKPIKTSINADLSATWKLLQKGYGMKRGDGYPCHICAVNDCIIHEPNAVQCPRWCKELHGNDENWQCFHQPFLDETKVQEMREELVEVESELQSILSNLDDILLRSNFNSVSEDPRSPLSEWQLEDQDSIHFDTTNINLQVDLKIVYENKIHQDLKLRSMTTSGTLKESQGRLQKQLIQEYTYRRLSESIKHADGNNKSFILLSDCTPCILHMEMRTILKFLQLILHAGLTDIKDSAEKFIAEKIKKYLEDINLIFNTEIFGNSDRPYTFKVPYDASKKVIDDVTLDGERCRQLSYNFHSLLSLCIIDDYSRNEWIIIIENYIKAFEIVRKKEDLTDNEIKEFQLYVDIFFQKYMELTAREGITNYFHMLGSGHIADYLNICGNLYVHSQQGWEAFNSFLKVFYFRRTTRGGGQGAQQCNRIRQLARWLARRLVWNSGMTYEDMLIYVRNMKNCSLDEVFDDISELPNTVHDEEQMEYGDISNLRSIFEPDASVPSSKVKYDGDEENVNSVFISEEAHI